MKFNVRHLLQCTVLVFIFHLLILGGVGEAITIDSFDKSSATISLTTIPSTGVSIDDDPGIFGGQRDLGLEFEVGTGGSIDAAVSGGSLTFDATGTGAGGGGPLFRFRNAITLDYDRDESSFVAEADMPFTHFFNAVDVDLTEGGSKNAFRLVFDSIGPTQEIRVILTVAWSPTLPVLSSSTFFLGPGVNSPTEFLLPFADFSADFTGVTGLTLVIGSNTGSFSLDTFDTVGSVPEPSTLFLLGFCLGGIGFFRRHKLTA